MRRNAKQPIMEKILPRTEETSLTAQIRSGIFSLLLMTASVFAVRHTMGEAAPQIWSCLMAGLLSLLCVAGGAWLKKKNPVAGAVWLLPWIGLLIMFRPLEWFHGFQLWINQLLSGWNQTYAGGAALYQIHNNSRDQMVIAMILVCLCGELSWKLVSEKRIFLCAVFSFTLILLQLLTGTEGLRCCLWLLFVLLSLMIFRGEEHPAGRCAVWETGMLACVLAFSILLPQTQMQSVTAFRNQVQQKVQEMRYGIQTLPEGDLNQAASLKENTEEMMTVQTGQEKTLYLRGFTGGSYDSSTGTWEPLSDADYGMEYSGMLEWLKNQNFDPLTQTAEYYQLGTEEQKPEENSLKIHITGAQREYLYLPCSLEKVKKGRAAEEKDTGLRSSGLTGIRNYEFRELSGSRPAELTMAESWVSRPQTEEQQQYLAAESVYRNFVYERETQVDESLRELIQELFWSDYETDQDGIYSALTQIRTVLKQPGSYARRLGIAESREDPVSWFLTGDHTGNDMFYASAAVLAFRVHGIPARYAEGYYISEDTIREQAGEAVTVTGQDAHAWVEVYFDGIGWLPLDVTPGYYYESVELQQMVSTPDMVRKTAALEHNQSEADQISGSRRLQASIPEKMAEHIGEILPGLAALVMILLTVWIVIRKLAAEIRHWNDRRIYRNADNRQRVQMLHNQLYKALAMHGIHGKLGWQTEETDREAVEKLEGVEPGMYTRVCRLLEKSIFGGLDLEQYEERTIQSFLEKTGQTPKKMQFVRKRKRL